MKKSGFFGKFFSKMLCFNCLGMLVFVTACLVGGLLWLDSYTAHGSYVEIPELKGENINVALRKLASAGLHGEVNDTGYVENVAGDIVLDQSVRPGTRVKSDRWVYLVVNSAVERKVALPGDIAGNCSMREAEMKLRARGFIIGTPEMITGDKNWVYEIKANGRVLKPGAMISVKTPLTLVVGDGDVEEEYTGGEAFYEEAFTDSTLVDSGSLGAADATYDQDGDALFE